METMPTESLESTARSLVAPGKGLLAADESTGTIERRLKSAGLASTEESRRAYRDLLFRAGGLGQFISGAILFDETIRQNAEDGTPFVGILRRQGIIPGIKVDRGARALAGFPGEKVTEGLDGLRGRLAEYAGLGARFTKWRAVVAIGPDLPTDACLAANAHALARFAALSQEAGLVPIVEPEVLMDGDHSIERHFAVTRETLQRVFQALAEQRVRPEGMLLKTGMVLSGRDHRTQAGSDEIAAATLRCLRETVPPAVPGIVFLSGGQQDVPATQNLDAINRRGPQPWTLTFSYGRALQDAALKTWAGRPGQVDAARRALLHRARCNAAAAAGGYSAALEAAA